MNDNRKTNPGEGRPSPDFTARSIDFVDNTEDDMPIRISRCDKTFNTMQVVEYSMVAMPMSNNPAACYKDQQVTYLILGA